MDHGGMDHGGMDHGAMCSMNVRSNTLSQHPQKVYHVAHICFVCPQMLFTWDTTNLCIVFRGWRITSTFTLILSLIAVAALTAGYELVRELGRRYEESQSQMIEGLPSKSP